MQGPQGPIGPEGPTGITGPAGRQGSVGVRGATGEEGLTGPQGIQGLLGFPRPSVPVKVQMFTGSSTVTIREDIRIVAAIAPLSTAYPSLDGSGNSSSIVGMSLNTNTITIPTGRYLVEAACTFPSVGDYGLQEGFLSIDSTTGTRILSGNRIGSSISNTLGFTSYMSGFVEFNSSTSVNVNYNVQRAGTPGFLGTTPFVNGDSIAVFVTFLKI
jgi:hypothetical protein